MRVLLGEMARFAIVGVASNALLLMVFAVMLRAGVGSVAAMSLVYLLGLALSFTGNRHWTFRHAGSFSLSLRRYAALHMGCYVLNACALLLLVEHLHWPALPVQAGAVVVIACILFAGQRYWVFVRSAD